MRARMGAKQIGTAAVALAAIFAGACASSPQLQPAAPAAPPIPSVESREAEELRLALEDASATIGSRDDVLPILVDADALRSMGLPEHASVRGAVRYFSTDLKDKIQRSLHRSTPYKSMIDQVLAERGLPSGLAWLPVIESAFVPTLTSRAGAHGLWQFMPETAREYGLRVDWWIDERADPVKSTRAAARYLEDLHGMFRDWPLALAAYNAGPGRVRRALQAHGASTFWELADAAALPRETRGYVPTFYATLVLVNDPQHYGFTLLPPARSELQTVEIDGPVSLHWIASVAGMEPDVLRQSNPSLRQGIVPPGRHPVQLPSTLAPRIIPRAAALRDEDPFVEVALYTIRPGDSPASLARRLSISHDDILGMNRIVRSAPRQGETIYLPLTQVELSRRLYPHDDSDARFHVVSRGETLYGIARAYGMELEQLIDFNQLSGNHILQPGERLLVAPETGVLSGGGM